MSNFEWVAAAVVAVMSTARITRLITWDHYPPSVWLRVKWHEITNDGPWSILVDCGYCFGLWAAGFVVGWGYLSGFHWTWWLFNGWLAAGYAGAMVMAYDGEDD